MHVIFFTIPTTLTFWKEFNNNLHFFFIFFSSSATAIAEEKLLTSKNIFLFLHVSISFRFCFFHLISLYKKQSLVSNKTIPWQGCERRRRRGEEKREVEKVFFFYVRKIFNTLRFNLLGHECYYYFSAIHNDLPRLSWAIFFVLSLFSHLLFTLPSCLPYLS